MKRAFLWLLILLALYPAALAEGFVFDAAIGWDSTPEDVQAYLGDAQIDTEDMGDYGFLEVVSGDDVTCLGFDCGHAVFMFYDGKLFAIYAYFTPESYEGDMQTLADRLTEDYGEANPERNVMTLDDLIFGVSGESSRTRITWTPDSNTIIELYNTGVIQNDDGSGYPWQVSLVVSNTKAAAEFDRALEGYLDEAD